MSPDTRTGRTLAEALPIARQRGVVQLLAQGPERLCDFAIVSEVPVAFVRVKFFERIFAEVPELIHALGDIIRRLLLIAGDPAVSRELWLRSKHGTWRFFRVCAGDLIEIGRDGIPVS